MMPCDVIPSSARDSIDIALALKLRESVDCDRILRRPRGESSFRVLQKHTSPLLNNTDQPDWKLHCKYKKNIHMKTYTVCDLLVQH